MLKRIKGLLNENRNLHSENKRRLKELDWANVYHDSIRGDDWINKTSLNIGRWAGGYPFFYVLTRILKDTKPKRILELGLGESTKVISKFIENCNQNATHLIIEHDENWKNTFSEKFSLAKQSNIRICPLIDVNVHGYSNKMYENFETVAFGDFDFIVIDGPFGSNNYSRYEIISKIKEFDSNNDFIILFDDTNRKGELETVQKIEEQLNLLDVPFYSATYEGLKSCTLICSKSFRFLTTL
jgi:16S rRNA G966 N2-methylase RsmD